MSETLTPLTDEQRANTATRIIHDAELLSKGAVIMEDGHLSPTNEQIDKLHVDNILAPQMKEFMTKTPEGEEIAFHEAMLGNLTNAIHSRLDHAVIREKGQHIPQIEDFSEYAEQNKLDIDFSRVLAERKLPTSSREYTQSLARRDFISPLNNLALNLIEFPEYSMGSEVTIQRNGYNGNPARLEDGWTVHGIFANGELEVSLETANDILSKQVSIDELQAWNNPAQLASTPTNS